MHRHRIFAIVFIVLAFGSQSAYADGWGTIKGRAVWTDAPHKPAEFKVDKNQDHCLAQGPLLSEKYVINAKNKGVRWVAVFLAKEDDGKADFLGKLKIHPTLAKIDQPTVVMDQPRCRFVPQLVILCKGQDFVGKNSSPISHNMQIQGGNGVNINPVLPAGGSVTVPANAWKPNAKGFPTSVSCGIHGWMKANVFCVEHPYFAVTDEDGNFEIKNAPAGSFRLVGWHDGWGWVTTNQEQSRNGIRITIEDGKTTSVTLSVNKSPIDRD